MSLNLNKVIIAGHMVADPVLKTTPNGISATSFCVAVNRRYSKNVSEDAQLADFINVVAWRRTAEFITRYFSKGSAICICGSIRTRSWSDTNGNKRYATEVLADEVNFVENKNANVPAEETRQRPLNDLDDASEEDLPF